ncbi:probable aquaporin TIP3-1 isoform X2 [Ricinus communis]|uniref:Aquaporin transporter, putative n=2 Tax=Ricinus communis TaxID=3988 RepID=B9T759_RICCO|nr:probable aquaporin TIP3-1 isoform X2 [Ricinus communis]EEF28306.1 aquaporin transporter, putative [Ricinus communis]|eukprot:XP_002534078.1 probable aquaporin TIP3-1 [Ricinus communis]
MWRAAVTELVATGTFLFTLSTTIIACLESHESDPKLLIPIAVFFIAFLWLMVTVPLSGGLFSPAFSFIAALRGVITFVRALFYSLGQLLGALIAYLILKGVMDPNMAHKYALAGCMVNGNGAGVSVGTALIIEILCTFMVLYVAMTIILDKQKCMDLGLTTVCVIISGIYAASVFVSITVTGRPGYGGVGLNPARCLGPVLLMGGALWEGHWVFWVGPFCACMIYYAYSLMLPKRGFVRADIEEDIIKLVRASCSGSDCPSCVEKKVTSLYEKILYKLSFGFICD